jgi:hypothetical protein
MELTFNATRDEKLKLVYDCLCSGVPTLAYAGFTLRTKDGQYETARQNLISGGMAEDRICIEDVQTQILRDGGELTFIDTEDGNKRTRLTMELIDQNWPKLSKQSRNMVNYISENYDAEDTDNILQVLLFGEVVYG